MWDYKSSRINFKVGMNSDGYLATEDEDVTSYANCKIDGIAQDADVESAQTLIKAFYEDILPFPNYGDITKTMVVTEA